MIDENVRQHVEKHLLARGWTASDDDIVDIITDAKAVYRKEISRHRWWNQYVYVVNIDGMFIEYVSAEANRDMSVYELGYEFEESTIREVVPVEKTITVYEPKKDMVYKDKQIRAAEMMVETGAEPREFWRKELKRLKDGE